MKGTFAVKAFMCSVAVAAALLAPRLAAAFCGFYVSGADGKLFNDATQVVLMREGTRTVLSMQNDYKGPVGDFAMVVPVPVVLQKENVKTLSRALFEKVDQLSAPRLVEYWEQDPCPKGELAGDLSALVPGRAGMGLTGLAGGGTEKPFVKIEAKFEVGEYEIVILSAQDSGSLDTWLRANKYNIPDGAEPALRPYVTAGSKFFVAKVNAAKVKFEAGRAQLSPLRFHYDSESFQLPVKLGMLNSSGTQDLIVQVLAPNDQRYAVANYPEAVIPTNLDVAESARGSFASFYAALFDKTLEANPRAVVTEYAWSAQGCDPCPGSVQGLTREDLASLGADVLPSARVGIPGEERGATSPFGEVQATVETGTPKIQDAERVVAFLRPRLRQCYTRGLESDPSMEGTLTIKVTAADDGSVTHTDVTSNKDLSANVTSCVSGVLRRAHVASGGTFTVTLKLTIPAKGKPTPKPSGNGAKEALLSIGNRFTLTRLHARYTSGALAEDLVFKVADPLMGGRERNLTNGKLERGAFVGGRQLGYWNAFQARYAIRHPWPGAITCEKPMRDRWGGPWPDAGASGGTAAATKLAYAPRDKALGTFLTQGLPDFRAEVRSVVEPDAGTTTPELAASTSAADAGAGEAGTEPATKAPSRCGCDLPGAPAGSTPALAASLAALFALVRSRGRRTTEE
ncbi:MAG: DUF2330 domain-containing protein [Deltaproteobacteria bacterium]|nr:DUF2330 domain-containing protein [Deltaproteobacteria bacterium]